MRSTHQRLLTAASVAAAAALLGACGSTVQLSPGQQSALSNGTGLGLDGVETGGTDSALPSSSATAPVRTGSAAVGALASGSTPGGTATTTHSATLPPSVIAGRGPVKVGLIYLKGVSTAASALGIGGLDPGDTQAQAKIVYNYINAHGGLAGRKVNLVSYGIQTSTDPNQNDTAQAAACASMVQDQKVALVVTIVNIGPAMMECFAKGKVPVVDDQPLTGELTANQVPYIAAPGVIDNARLMKVLVDALWRQGWLSPSSKIGLYSTDTPETEAIVQGPLVSALAAHGLKATKTIATTSTDAVTQSSAHALQFKTAGVDRIIPVALSPLFLMNGANSQGYYPKYALYSAFGPGALFESSAPKKQLEGSAGVGWQPSLDLNKSPRPADSAATKLCLKLMTDNGEAPRGALERGFELNVCSTAFYTQTAANAIDSIVGTMFQLAGPKVGTSFQPADTFAADMSKRYDGVSKYHDLTFVDSCSCFQYVGPLHPTD